MNSETKFYVRIATIVGAILIGVIFLFLWGCPQYNVWRSEMNGKAQLANAEYSKQVLVQEANANLEAERLNAEAEVVRAQGTADARAVEGFGMTNEEYIQYLWIKKLSMAGTSVIYLPAEGGIPVLTLDADPANVIGESLEEE